MNLRITEQQLRFRITPDELQALMAGKLLHACMDLGVQQFEYRVAITEDGAPLAFYIDKGIWNLTVEKTALAECAASLPSREGIEQEVQPGNAPITLVLEVDVRRSKKP